MAECLEEARSFMQICDKNMTITGTQIKYNKGKFNDNVVGGGKLRIFDNRDGVVRVNCSYCHAMYARSRQQVWRQDLAYFSSRRCGQQEDYLQSVSLIRGFLKDNADDQVI